MVIRAVSSFSDFVSGHNVAKNPVQLAILLAGGAFLTFVGWFRAERFDPARDPVCRPKNTACAAGFRLTPLSTVPHQPLEGRGGILFRCASLLFTGSPLICLPATMLVALALAYAPGVLASPDLISSRGGFFRTIEPTMIILGTLFIFLGRSILTHLLFCEPCRFRRQGSRP